MLNWIKNIFKKDSYLNEDELISRLSEENLKEDIDDKSEELFKSSVIRYIRNDEDNPPVIDVLCEDFHGPIMPEPGSIIWVSVDGGVSRPFKCIRYDFFESGDEDERRKVYIVVHPAVISDIMPKLTFQES